MTTETSALRAAAPPREEEGAEAEHLLDGRGSEAPPRALGPRLVLLLSVAALASAGAAACAGSAVAPPLFEVRSWAPQKRPSAAAISRSELPRQEWRKGCNPSKRCYQGDGCGEERCLLCEWQEQVLCCISAGISKADCCNESTEWTQNSSVCRSNCDVFGPCRDCQGEKCLECREEAQVKCCIRSGTSAIECCSTASASIQSRPVCKSECDVSTPCHGCGGEQCLDCQDDQRFKCCIHDGNSLAECCKRAPELIRERPQCKSCWPNGLPECLLTNQSWRLGL